MKSEISWSDQVRLSPCMQKVVERFTPGREQPSAKAPVDLQVLATLVQVLWRCVDKTVQGYGPPICP